MLAITGKRLSDVASIDDDRLRAISRDGACVVRILKTRKMSRVEIPEILRGDKPTRVAGGNSLVASTSLTRSDITKRLATFQQWATTSRSSTDSAVRSDTCSLDRHYDRESLREIVRRAEIPRLSYHALRRAFTGYKFLHGYDVDVIREILDYDDRAQTNEYINNCLYEIERI